MDLVQQATVRTGMSVCCSRESRGSRRAVLIVVTGGLHQCAEILAQLVEGRPADVPPAVIHPVNREIGREREGVGEGY